MSDDYILASEQDASVVNFSIGKMQSPYADIKALWSLQTDQLNAVPHLPCFRLTYINPPPPAHQHVHSSPLWKTPGFADF